MARVEGHLDGVGFHQGHCDTKFECLSEVNQISVPSCDAIGRIQGSPPFHTDLVCASVLASCPKKGLKHCEKHTGWQKRRRDLTKQRLAMGVVHQPSGGFALASVVLRCSASEPGCLLPPTQVRHLDIHTPLLAQGHGAGRPGRDSELCIYQ